MNTFIHGRRTAIALFVALTVAFTVSACTPPEEPTEPTPVVTEPTPTPTVEPASVPLPVLGIECADLATAASIASTFPASVSAVDASETIMGAYPTIPKTYHLRSLGGLACEWNNGEPQSSTTGTNPDYVGVQVLVLPHAESQWAKYEDYYGGSGAIGTYCSPGSVPISCTTNQLVGTTWVEVSVAGSSTEASGTALSAEILAAVADAGPGAEPWVVPADVAPLPTECTGIISDADAQAALALGVPVQAVPPAGGWSLPSAASQNWGGPYCSWLYLDADAGVGSLNTLPGGAWAWAEAREFITVPSAPEAVAITGLAATDEAWIRCAPADETCLVDLIIGGNWISVYVWADEGMEPLGVDRRTGAIALATAIVATL